MNEEKKLSELLDDIFGDYINNETGSDLFSQKNTEPSVPEEDFDYIIDDQNNFDADSLIRPEIEFTPVKTKTTEQAKIKPALTNFIENLFMNGDIINETDISFNRFSTVKSPSAALLPKKPFEENETKILNNQQKLETPLNLKYNDITKKEELSPVKKAYTAKSVCNQLYELFYIYNRLIKLSRKFNPNMLMFFKNGINEVKPLAENVYGKITGQSVNYHIENIYLKSDTHALNLIKDRINSIFDNIQNLENSIDDNILKYNLKQINALLSFQLETINSIN